MPLSRRAFLGALGALPLAKVSLADSPEHPPVAMPADVDALVVSLTTEEKLTVVAGLPWTLGRLYDMVFRYNTEPILTGSVPAKGVSAIGFTDGPRGVVMYRSTCFPVAMARGASWDPELEARIGDAIGVEARAQGANLFAGVCINLLRHPGWGRAQETYGEDPVLLGEMGAALVRGVQRHVMACVKHFACNSIEDSRFRVSVEIDERALHEVYLPHFKRCVDEGAAAVMSAYNKVNGVYCGENEPLLTGILKKRWGFEGFVMSDFWWGVYDGPRSLAAGLDLEMPFKRHFFDLEDALQEGAVSPARLDDAVRRLVKQHARFAAVGEPERYHAEAVAGPEHRALARESAAASMVLLKNDAPAGSAHPLLPLDAGALRRVAVIGALADAPNIGDEGSSRVRPPHVVTPLAGLRTALPGVAIEYVTGRNRVDAALAAKTADACVVVVGFTHADEGENIVIAGGDRRSLRLRERDEKLLRVVADANPRTVAVLIGGSAVVTEAWRAAVPAVLMAWYPGMEGGHALADVLLGRVNPSGKLPCVFPKSEADLPPFDPDAAVARYGLFHGQRLLDRSGVSPAFAFGFGLSYTTFSVGAPRLAGATLDAAGQVRLTVNVKNTGARAGSEVLQLYAGYPESAVERPLRELKAFRKVRLAPGEAQEVTLAVPVRALAYFDEKQGDFVVEKQKHLVYVGTSSRSADLQALELQIV